MNIATHAPRNNVNQQQRLELSQLELHHGHCTEADQRDATAIANLALHVAEVEERRVLDNHGQVRAPRRLLKREAIGDVVIRDAAVRFANTSTASQRQFIRKRAKSRVHVFAECAKLLVHHHW